MPGVPRTGASKSRADVPFGVAFIQSSGVQLLALPLTVANSILIARMLGPEGRGQLTAVLVGATTLMFVLSLGTFGAVTVIVGRDVKKCNDVEDGATLHRGTTGDRVKTTAIAGCYFAGAFGNVEHSYPRLLAQELVTAQRLLLVCAELDSGQRLSCGGLDVAQERPGDLVEGLWVFEVGGVPGLGNDLQSRCGETSPQAAGEVQKARVLFTDHQQDR